MLENLGKCDRMSVEQVSAALGVHKTTCQRWVYQGVRGRRLPTILLGGRVYVRSEDLSRFLQQLNQDRSAKARRPTPPAETCGSSAAECAAGAKT